MLSFTGIWVICAISFVDEDYQHEPEHRGQPPSKEQYLKDAWDDFIQNQLTFFTPTPVFVGIGNHEIYAPKNRDLFVAQFADWLDSPILQKQRLADNPQDHKLRPYYHWIQGGVDFIYLDNATPDQFDDDQIKWFEGVLSRASTDSQVRAVVVGMHEALPDSLAQGHSMQDTGTGTESGRHVYNGLWRFHQKTQKHVYILASHSHFYMSGIFDSDYWHAHAGPLPGWIIGTGGAMRYPLPPTASRAQEARQKVYGFLTGTVHADGSIDFSFHEVPRNAVPQGIVQRYTSEFVDYCFNQNADFK
jgi:hypothetical protein